MDNTHAERQRRYIAKPKAAATAQSSVTNARCPACAEKDGEIAALKGRLEEAQARPAAAPSERMYAALWEDINRLTQENAALHQRAATAETARDAAAPADKQEIARLNEQYRTLYGIYTALTKKHITLERQLAAARAAGPGASPAEEKASLRLAREIDALKAALAKAEAKLAADPGEVGKLGRQLKAARTHIKNLQVEVRWVRDAATKKGLAVSKTDRRTVHKALHPNSEQEPARKKLLNKAEQIINPLLDALSVPGE